MNNKFYNIDEIRQKFKNVNRNSFFSYHFDRIYFKYKLFRKMYRDYFKRTPESDSLYRRRNRLVILAISGLFYYKTSKGIFNRIELEVFYLKKGITLKKIMIPIYKSVYFISLIFMSQLLIKYIYYLNKVFKSYQFALEGLLKFNIMEREYIYQGDSEETGKFDIVDSENIKKNQ